MTAPTFETTRGVDLGGVIVARSIALDAEDDTARFLDTFTNTNDAPVDVDVSFGGALGYGTGTSQGSVVDTSTGDDDLGIDDTWSVVARPSAAQRPVGLAIGVPDVDGSVTSLGNQERDPFTTPRAESGHESNFYGYVSSLTVEPGETRSLVRWVVVGPQGEGSVATVAESLDALVTEPDLDDLAPSVVCSVANRDLASVAGFDEDACPETTVLDVPAAPDAPAEVTRSRYDVVDKSIAELQADMEAGVTTSVAITQAYLDRIAAYNSGTFGFHAFIHVADDALAQARKADSARKQGATGELLGMPVAVKDLYDTKDMPTTGGSLALEGWQPDRDAFQVEGLRDSGAVIIGKTNLSEFARSGAYSQSGFAQVWNGLYPSKTSLGSSGGSATAVAASMAPAAMGSQTGVSLYPPSTGASLVTFRGTDGMHR